MGTCHGGMDVCVCLCVCVGGGGEGGLKDDRSVLNFHRKLLAW